MMESSPHSIHRGCTEVVQLWYNTIISLKNILSRKDEQIMTDKNRISTFLDDETTELLKQQALKEGRSVSNLISYIIKKYLNEN